MKIVLLFMVGTAIAVAGPTSRIVGGEPTGIDRYSFMSNVQAHFLSAIWMQACGGSLLTRFAVLTAAHCYDATPSIVMWRVQLGSTQREFGGTRHSLSRVTTHPDFNRVTREANIAIMHLATPAPISEGWPISLARIAGPNYVVPDGAPVTIIGWGSTWDLGPAPDVLQRGTVNTINQNVCIERYNSFKTQPVNRNWPEITSGTICAGILDVGGAGTCQGDSGGPLLHFDDIVVGVISWTRCGNQNLPDVFTRVSFYSDWIVENASS